MTVGGCRVVQNVSSLIGVPFKLYPAVWMSALWIVVSPVHDPTLIIPLEFTIKLNRITLADPFHPGCEVNVMSNEQRSSVRQPEQYALMPLAFKIIRQEFDYSAVTLHLNVFCVVSDGSNDALFATTSGAIGCGRATSAKRRDGDDAD